MLSRDLLVVLNSLDNAMHLSMLLVVIHLKPADILAYRKFVLIEIDTHGYFTDFVKDCFINIFTEFFSDANTLIEDILLCNLLHIQSFVYISKNLLSYGNCKLPNVRSGKTFAAQRLHILLNGGH